MKKVELHIVDKFVSREFFKERGKVKIVLVHKPKQRYENDLVVMKYGDLMELTSGLLQSVEVVSD